MTDLGIEDAVRAVLTSMSNPPVPMLEIDSIEDPPLNDRGGVANHTRFHVEVAPSAAFALARGGTILRRGFVQVDVYSPESAGRAAARALGDRIIGVFPRLTRLGLARVERPAYATEPLQETPFFRVPVTVPWDARVPEGVT